jgi:hypothetical protein
VKGNCWFEKTGIEKNQVHAWEAASQNIYKKTILVTKLNV